MYGAIGIVNYEGPNVQVKGMQDYRPVSASSFLRGYRLVDFPISNLSSSGVNHIKVSVKTNLRSLLKYLGTGRHYNINSRRGKLHILPAKSMDENNFYSNDTNSYMYNMQVTENANYPYAALTPSHFVFRQDSSALPDMHIESGVDITMLYQNADNVEESFVNCDVVNLNKQKGVLLLERNRGNPKPRTISLETYILSKELLTDLIRKATNISSLHWFRDTVDGECVELDIRGITHRSSVACINDLKSYYSANMGLLDCDETTDLFHTDWPVHTRTSDSCPTQYYAGASVKNSMVSSGCLVEGDIENSAIGHRVVTKKGAAVKNCVIPPDAIIGEGMHIENVVVDKKAGVVRKKESLDLADALLYVKRNDRIQWQEY